MSNPKICTAGHNAVQFWCPRCPVCEAIERLDKQLLKADCEIERLKKLIPSPDSEIDKQNTALAAHLLFSGWNGGVC